MLSKLESDRTLQRDWRFWVSDVASREGISPRSSLNIINIESICHVLHALTGSWRRMYWAFALFSCRSLRRAKARARIS